MPLSSDQYHERANAWIDAKWPHPRTCPICRVVPRKWSISLPAQVPVMPDGDGESRQFVLLPVMCSNCSYVANFNTQAMQLFGEGFDIILKAPPG
jgi:hypothetical protein